MSKASLGIEKPAQDMKNRSRYLTDLLAGLIAALEPQMDQLTSYYQNADSVDLQNLGSWEAIVKAYEKAEGNAVTLSAALNDVQNVYTEKLISEKRLS